MTASTSAVNAFMDKVGVLQGRTKSLDDWAGTSQIAPTQTLYGLTCPKGTLHDWHTHSLLLPKMSPCIDMPPHMQNVAGYIMSAIFEDIGSPLHKEMYFSKE